MNGKDPLLKAGPDYQRELFVRLAQEASHYPREHVNGAAANLIINSLRQACPTRAAAEVAFDELFGRMKALLLDHYVSGGRKKGVFPFNQILQPMLLRDKDKMNGSY